MRGSPAPMDLPDVIAAAFSACVRHWSVLARVALLGAVLSAVLYAGFISTLPIVDSDQELTQEQSLQFGRDSTLYLAGMLLVKLLTHLSLIDAGLRLLRGKGVAVERSLLAGARALPIALAAAGIAFALLTAAVVGLAIVLRFPVLLALIVALSFSRWGRLWLASVLRVYGLMLLTVVGGLLLSQVVVDTRSGPLAAVRRTRELARGHAWRILTVGLSVLVVCQLPDIIATPIAAGLGTETTVAISNGLVVLFAAPFLALGHSQLYLDLLARRGEPVRPTPPPERASV